MYQHLQMTREWLFYCENEIRPAETPLSSASLRFQHDFLPPRITKLHLHIERLPSSGDSELPIPQDQIITEQVTPMLHEIIQAKAEFTPHLEALVVSYTSEWPDHSTSLNDVYSKDMIARLEGPCNDANVKLRVEEMPPQSCENTTCASGLRHNEVNRILIEMLAMA